MAVVLSPLEARVLGVLMEKERTVPDTYPMTLNALVAGCNQKTSRDPIITTTETQVQAALDSLKHLSLVIESSGGRVSRYSHNFERVLQVPRQAAALLAVLMLRGPQTSGELRINCERLHAFTDISSVEAFLRELAERPEPLAAELPRSPGERENRWLHLLTGAPVVPAAPLPARAPAAASADDGDLAALEARVARLEDEVRALRALVEEMRAKLRPAG